MVVVLADGWLWGAPALSRLPAAGGVVGWAPANQPPGDWWGRLAVSGWCWPVLAEVAALMSVALAAGRWLELGAPVARWNIVACGCGAADELAWPR